MLCALVCQAHTIPTAGGHLPKLRGIHTPCQPEALSPTPDSHSTLDSSCPVGPGPVSDGRDLHAHAQGQLCRAMLAGVRDRSLPPTEDAKVKHSALPASCNMAGHTSRRRYPTLPRNTASVPAVYHGWGHGPAPQTCSCLPSQACPTEHRP